MYSDFVKKLSLWAYNTKVGVQKINDLKLDTFDMVIVFFFVEDKEGRFRFLKETFFLAYINIDITFRMLFFTLSNDEIDFIGCHIYWKIYTIAKVLLTIG